MHIQTARDAETFLLNCWRDPSYGQDEHVIFNGCVLRFKLDPGTGEADFKMLRAVRLLQRHVGQTYVLAKGGVIGGRLTEADEARLGINLTVRRGSTEGGIPFANALKTLQAVLPSHWPTRTRNIIVCGVALAYLAHPYVHEYKDYRAHTDAAQIAADAAVRVAEHTDRINLEIAKVNSEASIKVAAVTHGQSALALGEAAAVPEAGIVLAHLAKDDPSNVVAYALSDHIPWRPAIMALAPAGGTLQWGDSAPIPDAVAKAVAKADGKAATAARRAAKERGRPGMLETPWVTEVLRAHPAPGAMQLGLSDA